MGGGGGSGNGGEKLFPFLCVSLNYFLGVGWDGGRRGLGLGRSFLCRMLNNKYNLAWEVFLGVGVTGWEGGQYKSGLNGKDAQDLEKIQVWFKQQKCQKKKKAESLLIKMRRYPYDVAFFNYRYFLNIKKNIRLHFLTESKNKKCPTPGYQTTCYPGDIKAFSLRN